MENQTQEQLQEQIDELASKVTEKEKTVTTLESVVEVLNNNLSVLRQQQEKVEQEQQNYRNKFATMCNEIGEIYPRLKGELPEYIFSDMMSHESPKFLWEDIISDRLVTDGELPSLEGLSAVATRYIPRIIGHIQSDIYNFDNLDKNRLELQDLRQQLENMKNDTGDIE